MPTIAEAVAQTALAQFDALPGKCKPRRLADGRREWTPMSAVVLVRTGDKQDPMCVSLATGTKCLPKSAMPKCEGLVIHDSHAEVLALRGFNYWLLSEVQTLLSEPRCESPFLEFCPGRSITNASDTSEHPPLRLKDDMALHFFTTEAPCGDASMEILTRSMPSDATAPWEVDGNAAPSLQGRGHFSLLGHVRRKPARGDAEASLSKSCTDKLAVKQLTSILSFPVRNFSCV